MHVCLSILVWHLYLCVFHCLKTFLFKGFVYLKSCLFVLLLLVSFCLVYVYFVFVSVSVCLGFVV